MAFLPLVPGSLLKPPEGNNTGINWSPMGAKWFRKNMYYDSGPGPNCCSDSAISFHYTSPASVSLINTECRAECDKSDVSYMALSHYLY